MNPLLTKDLADIPAGIAQAPSSRLTDEQKAVVACDLRPGDLAKVVAFAGTGKTSTFVAYANARPNTQMCYLAFNKSVEQEAKQRFGPNVLPKTVHALAYKFVGHKFNTIKGAVQNWQVAKALRIPIYEATLIVRTLETYLNSASDDVELVHVEPDHLKRLPPGYEQKIADLTRTVWSAVQAESHGFEMTHGGYLKLYQLSRPTIPGDIILLDEAQDTNPVTQALVLSQLHKGKAVLMCGDPYQQIYAWRGAVDAMEQCLGKTYRLTQSFRFPQHVADIANIILKSFFNETAQLRGLDVDCMPEVPPMCTTVTRTNATIFKHCAAHATQKQPFHVIGREAFYQLLDQILDVFMLYCGKRDKVVDRRVSRHNTFNDLKEFAENTLDVEITSRCLIVEEYGDQIPSLIRDMRSLYMRDPQPTAPIYVTCHKAKGLEWDSVRIADDYDDLYDETGKLRLIGADPLLPKDEVNLLYVAATRAKKTLQLNRDLRRLCSHALLN